MVLCAIVQKKALDVFCLFYRIACVLLWGECQQRVLNGTDRTSTSFWNV